MSSNDVGAFNESLLGALEVLATTASNDRLNRSRSVAESLPETARPSGTEPEPERELNNSSCYQALPAVEKADSSQEKNRNNYNHERGQPLNRNAGYIPNSVEGVVGNGQTSALLAASLGTPAGKTTVMITSEAAFQRNSGIKVEQQSPNCSTFYDRKATISSDSVSERHTPKEENEGEEDSASEGGKYSVSTGAEGSAKKSGLRKGKWTTEEEEYTTRVIHYFSSGLLTLPEGKTLRSYLAEKLKCDPMRITKKYAGASCLGKRIYHLCESTRFARHEVEMAKVEVERLEQRFKLRLEQGAGVPLPSLNPMPPVPMASDGQPHNMAQSNPMMNPMQLVQPSVHQELFSGGIHGYPQVAMQACAPATIPAPSAVSISAASNASSWLNTLMHNAQSAAAQVSTPNTARPPAPVSNIHFQQPIIPHTTSTSSISGPLPHHPAMPAMAWPLMVSPKSPQLGINNTGKESVARNNENLAQVLLAQIQTQLQAVAALSPATLRQIQPQLLATLTMSPNSMSQNAGAGAGAGAVANPALFVQNIQQQQPVGRPGQEALPQSLLAPNSSTVSLGREAQIISMPSTPATTSELKKSTSSPGFNSSKPTPFAIHPNHPTLSHQSSPELSQSQHTTDCVDATSAQEKMIGDNQTDRKDTGNTMMDFLSTLRRGHAEAVEKVRREEASQLQTVQNARPMINHISHAELKMPSTFSQESGRGILSRTPTSNRKRQKPSAGGSSGDTTISSLSSEGATTLATKSTSRSLSSLSNSGTSASNDKSENAAKQTPTSYVATTMMNNLQRGSFVNRVKTDASSGSGCTTNPFESEESASSAENMPSYGGKDCISTSNSSSDDDKEEQRRHYRSIPLRKRFKQSTNNSGMTFRSLADHNFRMDAELRNPIEVPKERKS